MTNTKVPARRFAAADAVLTGAAGFWLAVALIGQWAFFYYIAVFYGASTLTGDIASWGRNTLVSRSYVAGDLAGNLAFGGQALAAGIVAFGGALQIIPQVRARFPTVHRWNGRLFLLTVTGLSLSGFYLVWVRKQDSLLEGLPTTLNGVLILTFAALALRAALKRDFVSHRRWALRLYLVSNAQWFIRVGFIAWVAVNGGPRAMATFFELWSYGCYLLPLAVLELYLRARAGGGPAARYAVAGGLVVLTLLMAVGSFGFTMFSQQIIDGTVKGLPG